jgi:pimeloyl-ACP methyl ester carboxylesterase
MLRRRTLVALAAAAGCSSLIAPIRALAEADATPTSPVTGSSPQSGYAPVNGLQMYYEIHGSGGTPLVLLHGSYGAIGLWGSILPELAQTRQVIAVELQGHGHTADIDRAITYERMADDIAGLLEHLGIAQADVFGYSMGGYTALRFAIQHPEFLRKLVVASASYTSDGVYPEVRAVVADLPPEIFVGSPEEAAYLETAPRPEDFPLLIEKLNLLDAQEFAWPAEEIEAIVAPTLLIYGDADIVRPEHAVELYRLLGGGVPGDFVGLPPSQLAVLPGTTHVGVITRGADLLLAIIPRFLDAPMPAAA